MSKWFSTWTFRSARPEFAPGEEITVYLTEYDQATGTGRARVGDSVLEISGLSSAARVDELVDLRVESFDPDSSRGRAVVRA